jgi:hypothetical protein
MGGALVKHRKGAPDGWVPQSRFTQPLIAAQAGGLAIAAQSVRPNEHRMAA